MGVIGYKMWSVISKELQKGKSKREFKNYSKYNSINKNYLDNLISKENKIIFLGMTDGDFKLQQTLDEKGYQLFPNPKFSKFIRNRKNYLPLVAQNSNYNLNRVFLTDYDKIKVKSTILTKFKGKKVVMKIGDFHASEGKWLLDSENLELPNIKYSMRKLPIVLEEFIPNSRSIRVGFVGSSYDNKSVFVTEQINSKNWLKNNNPEAEITYSYEELSSLNIPEIYDLIKEIKMLGSKYKADLIGADFVVSPKGIYLLELNDMIGLPESDYVKNLVCNEVTKFILREE